MAKRTPKVLIICLVLLILATALTGCGKDKPSLPSVTYDDIYANNSGVSPYTEAELAYALPAGYTPYINDNDYGYAYLADYDILLVQRVEVINEANVTFYGAYSLVTETLLAGGANYVEFGTSYGMLSLRSADDKCVLIDKLGNYIFDEEDGYTATSLQGVFVPISKDYVAVRAAGGLYNIFTSDGVQIMKADNTPFAITSAFYTNSNKTSVQFGLKAVDDYIIRTVYNKSLKVETAYIYSIDAKAQISEVYKNMTVPSATAADYTRGIFYLGDDIFYCYEFYKADSTAYQFKLDTYYYKASVWTFNGADGKKTVLNPDNIFVTVINEYYDQEVSQDVDKYIRDGFSYVSVAFLRLSDKTASTEQYIIDSSMHIYVSSTGTMGSATIYSSLNSDFRDVMIQFSAGIGVASDSVGDLMVFDTQGNTLFRKAGRYTAALYNNGIVVAKQWITGYTTTTTADDIYYFAAFDLSGKPVFSAEDREYTMMSAYVDGYALAEKELDSGTKIQLLVDKNGIESQLTDVYKNTNKAIVYKNGIYVFKTGSYFGIKNYSGEIVLAADDNTWMVLDKRGVNKVLCYTKNAEGNCKFYILK